MSSTNTTRIFGIRHHGPGGARSLRAALEEQKPDVVLVEGPPDADGLLALLSHKQMEPPVALLVYRPDAPQQAVYYPFAVFSPEYQAIRYALQNKIPVRFMDLPIMHHFADECEVKEEAKPTATEQENEQAESPDALLPESLPLTVNETISIERDPLRWLAEAAGYSDSERWWEHMVEERQDGTELFAAILEAMTALRREVDKEKAAPGSEATHLVASHHSKREAHREAWMRRTMRQAHKEGFQNIAVVCGAWHAPALAETLDEKFSAKDDEALLKGLPKVKVQAAWVPWTYGRLCAASGYGAGIESPGWYDHLWQHREQTAIRWMTRVAGLLRAEGLDASSAHVIEAVRLGETLAAMRGRPLPGLPEMSEAIQAIFCFGGDAQMQLIHDKLIVADRLGGVPDEVPLVPLQQDLQREQKRLRLAATPEKTPLKLDLRNANDLDRSRLLHRLYLLDLPWGRKQRVQGALGTFREEWILQWQPEFAVQLIEAGVWGNTIAEATSARVRDMADKADTLPPLTSLLKRARLAELPQVTPHVMMRLENQAAVTADIAHLMDSLPELAELLRYGDVRGGDQTAIGAVVEGIFWRVCIGLPGACSMLDDNAAQEMTQRLSRTHDAILLLQNEELNKGWHDTLRGLCDRSDLHGLPAGRLTRLLHDGDVFDTPETARRMSLALSTASEPAQAAHWIEGFLPGSGLVLLHDETLWAILDEWVSDLSPDAFVALLPLLRRTFSNFAPGERRSMGERVVRGRVALSRHHATPQNFDRERADAVLPLLAQILGLPLKSQ